MSTENMEKIRKYKEELEKTFEELKEERQLLIEKMMKGEKLSGKEVKRNSKLVSLIKETEDKLNLFKSIDNIDELIESLNEIADSRTSSSEKTKLFARLVKKFEELNDIEKNKLQKQLNLSDEEIQDIEKLKIDLENSIKELDIEKTILDKRGFDVSKIEKEIEEKKEILSQINKYEKESYNITKLEDDLNKLIISTTSQEDKDTIIIEYTILLNTLKTTALDELAKSLDLEPKKDDEDPTKDPKDKKSLKEKTKEKLAAIGEKLKNNKKKIIAIGSVAVLAVAIAIAAKSCSKQIENDKNNNNDLNPGTSTEQMYQDANKDTINALTAKGYNEYSAMLMVTNFNDSTIDTLKTIPYNPAVENYATVKEFNINYINDYETARTIYNIAPDKVVDYVNRSAKIIETGFYNDATINDVVAVVKSIDEQDLFRAENGELEHSINATLTEIYNSYAFTTNNEENNITKLEAFKYFAKEGSDLDLFLTEYATLTQNVLINKTDAEKGNEAKQKVYNFLDTFANTFAGNSYDLENPNEDAIVTDTYDWNIAYSSFIKPLMSMYITEQNVEEFVCLQINMLSNYEQWAQANTCVLPEDESRTLGGE